MKFLVIRHIDFIKLISEVKNDKKRFLSLRKKASNSEINALSELVNNIIKMLRKHVTDLRIIGDKCQKIQNRRKRLALKGGLFLPGLMTLALSALGALI